LRPSGDERMIVANSLTRIYGSGAVAVHALRDVSLSIERGEFVAIMGPSGSGKSTLLHLLGLLDRPTQGALRIAGIDVLDLSDREQTRFRLDRLGYVFQDYALVSELLAEENVSLPCRMRGAPERECEEVAADLLGRVGLGGRARHRQAELSGGEQQRVAIARALANSPEIVLADEPCANLDSENSRIVLDLFRRLNEERGQTIVMVTHEDWHREYCSRIVSMRDGRIVGEERNRAGSSGPGTSGC
jgi:putative ABC transport system ATP-binding protein